jgi:TRAP-type uncharacterized transport system fused permease subunit
VDGYPIAFAAVESIVVVVVVGLLHPVTRRGPLAVVHSLALAAERSVNVALPCAVAGVIVSVIAFTGLGTKFTAFMVYLSGGNVPLMLAFAMLSSLVLGAGMPTTSAYIMAAVLVAPALIQSGVEPLLAHFFILYFAILSMLTPPVALAAYAAASISGASSSQTGWQAFALALPGFVIPFALFAHPGVLLIGDVADTLWGVANILAGFVGIGAAVVGWLFRPMNTAERIYFGLVGAANLWPTEIVSAVTFALLVAGAVWLWRSSDRVSDDRV